MLIKIPANFDDTSAVLQPNKKTKDINNSKKNEKTSNKEQISEKEEQAEQRKRKSWVDCPLMDHQRSNPNRKFRMGPYCQ